MKGSGGTEGGIGQFAIGLILSLGAVYFFLDSVQVRAGGYGWVSRWTANYHTSSQAIVFVPFFLGVVALFYDASKRWAWWLMYAGLGVICVEILSRIQFYMSMKTTHLMLILTLLAAGLALMLRSYRKLPS